MTYETLVVERRGPVAWLIFNRPESLNAHNIPMLQEVPRAWAELDEDDDVRVIVITGLGRGFSVGADVKEANGSRLGPSQTAETSRAAAVAVAIVVPDREGDKGAGAWESSRSR